VWWVELEADGSGKCGGVRAAFAGVTPQSRAGGPGGPHSNLTPELIEEAFLRLSSRSYKHCYNDPSCKGEQEDPV